MSTKIGESKNPARTGRERNAGSRNGGEKTKNREETFKEKGKQIEVLIKEIESRGVERDREQRR